MCILKTLENLKCPKDALKTVDSFQNLHKNDQHLKKISTLNTLENLNRKK